MNSSRKLERRQTRGTTLSLCMIVKNEADGLEKCLSTARPHVDEIVIVDTGSTDATLEIAGRYADILEEIEWPDSFAEARNHSIDLATGDFIVVLDGDEFLPDPLHWRRIRKAISSGDVAVVRIPVRNLLPEGQLIAADRMWQERVFKNDPVIRYQGRVHNQHFEGMVAYMDRTGHRLVEVASEVIHTGYAHSVGKMKEKYRVRLHLLEEEFRNASSEKHKAYYGFQLGVVHYVLEDYEQVLDTYGALDFDELEDYNAFYTHLLASQAALKCKLPTRALIHCNGMLSLNRDEPVAYQISGLAFLQAHQFSDGLLMLLEALAKTGDAANARFVLNAPALMRTLARICNDAGLDKHGEAFLALAANDEFHPDDASDLVQSLKLGLVQSQQRAVA
jgi:glycosyltransferase involved in cell wall biosynthesis